MMSVLVVNDLKRIYGSKAGNVCNALQGINLTVEKGDFVGIMGPSGAGKTTLLNIVATIDKPTSGSVFLDGENIVNLREPKLTAFRRNKLGFVFQDFNLLDTLTLEENIVLPLALSRVKVAEIEQRVKRICTFLGIDDILKKYPYEVSGGQKQRAAIARAIINEPQLVLADEPTGALDSRSSREVLQGLSDLNENKSATIMMVTHDAFAASYCKRIVFIKDGILFSELNRGGSRKEFFQQILKMLAALGGDQNDLL